MRLRLISLTLVVVLAGCSQFEETDSEFVALESANGLSGNGLAWNGLAWNGLAWNGLAWNGLALVTLLNGQSPIEAFLSDPFGTGMISKMLVKDPTGLGYEVVKYSAACGLPAGDVAVIAGESFEGALGLLTQINEANLQADWPSAGLNNDAVRWWFACMLAHVNAFGKSVPISIRARHPEINSADPGFPYFEGAFWGDLGTPQLCR